MFELTEKQKLAEKILAGPARHVLLRGGSRCVAGDTILDGHTKTIRELADDGSPIDVKTSCGIQRTEAPYLKGRAGLLKFILRSGREIEVTPDHRFWNGQEWINADSLEVGDAIAVSLDHASQQIPQETISEPCLSKLLEDVQRSMKIGEGLKDDCSYYCHLCDQQPHPSSKDGQAYCALRCDVLARNHSDLHEESCRASQLPESNIHTGLRETLEQEYNQTYRPWFHPSKKGASPSTYLGEQSKGLVFEHISSPSRDQLPDDVLSLLHSCQIESFLQRCDDDPNRYYVLADVSCDTPASSGYSLDDVLFITETAEQDFFTVHVPIVEHYFANGILHHNSGKTFLIVRSIVVRALGAPGSQHAIFRRNLNSARASIWKGTLRDVLKTCWPGVLEKCTTNESEMLIIFPNGSTILVAGLDDEARVDKVLGLEFATIYLNECSEIHWPSVSVVMTRLSQKVATLKNPEVMLRPKFFADMNPQGSRHWTYEMFIEKLKPGTLEAVSNPDNYDQFHINPVDNAQNIDADYLASLNELSAAARRRFLDGEWSQEVDGALFTTENIDSHRVTEGQRPALKRIVVAVDPSVTSGVSADETGIVVAGLGMDGRAYVLADVSMKGASPETWGRAVIAAYREWGAGRVVAERNQGGELIETLLRNIDRNVSYKPLWSSKGKASRAEPVSSLYERGLVSHVGEFKMMESQLCSLTTGFSKSKAGFSPDRADALVFAITELMIAPQHTVRKVGVKGM